MPTLNLTEVLPGEPREWSPKDKPNVKNYSYKVKDDTGTVYEISTKGDPPKLGPDEFKVTPPKPGTSFPPKLSRVFQGGGGGRGRSPEETARIERMAAHKTAAAICGSLVDSTADKATYLALFKEVTDWLIADLPASAPQTASAPSSQPPADDRKGFTSDKQKRFMESLLKKAGGSPETVGTILTYCSEALTPTDVSAAIDTLNSENSEAVRACAKELAKDANEWIVRDTPFPPDEADLPQVAA